MSDSDELNSAGENGSHPQVDGENGITPDATSGEDFLERSEKHIDEVMPAGYETQPVVGLGGSAGSFEALQAFFEAMPPDTGLVFVVVIHLLPDQASGLAPLMQRWTTMQVVAASDSQKVEINHVYVIPPGKVLTMTDGHLRLKDLQPVHGKRIVVDLFFRSLAESHGPHACAIVLSGADGDGSIGIKRVKEWGGLTIAQDPDHCQMDSMPRSAIATGMVDWVLEAGDIPRHLLEYLHLEKLVNIPLEVGEEVTKPEIKSTETALVELLGYLKSQTRRDFSGYKRATILRRVARRMQVVGETELPAYLIYVRKNVGECRSLVQDLLISVTNFFRDRDAFDSLSAHLPKLFRGKDANSTVRVWVPACATGEEAYSLAIMLLEYVSKLDSPPTLQLFATDLNDAAIRVAREGVYPDTIVADVSEERLRRFFVRDVKGYRVHREVRDLILFAPHDILKDSPFSRLDLISCRNFLIYINKEAQTRAFEVFHFALRYSGLLFLGTSESLEAARSLFTIVDKKNRIFTPTNTPRPVLPFKTGPSEMMASLESRWRSESPVVPLRDLSNVGGAVPLAGRSAPTSPGDKASWPELHFRLLEQLGPPSVIVNSDYEIMHLSKSAGRYLHFSGGEPTTNLLKAVDPMLRIELRAALSRAEAAQETIELKGLTTELSAGRRAVDIRVQPAGEIATGYLLVSFADAGPGDGEVATKVREPAAEHLEQELERAKQNLRETVEQHEGAIEELKASNEELQAMNEELRSATEELETSREELESIGEELTTVNNELKSKVDELAHANGELNNLMAATAIASVFLDRELQIARYTPSAVTLFNFIASDIGRPLAHLTHRLEYPELVGDAQRVLADLTPIEREVPAKGDWFLARLLPYRTVDDHIAGVVLTFIDITERKRASEAQRESEDRYRALLDTVDEAFAIYEPVFDGEKKITDFRVLEFNPMFAKQAGTKDPQRKTMRELGSGLEDPWMENYLRVWRSGEPFRFQAEQKAQGKWFDIFATRLGAAEHYKLAVLFSDITSAKRGEEALRASEERLRLIVESAREYAIFTVTPERMVTSWGTGAERLLGYTEGEVLNNTADIIFTPEDRAAQVPREEAEKALAAGRVTNERWHRRKDGTLFWGSGAVMTMQGPDGKVSGLVNIFRDETANWQLRRGQERTSGELTVALAAAEAAGRAKDQFLAMLSHELRTPLNPVLMVASEAAADQSLSEDTRAMFETVRRNVEHEARLIDDLLDVTRAARGKIALVKQVLDVHELLRDACGNARGALTEKHLDLKLELAAARHQVNGDSTRLMQVFGNILNNAMKFTASSGRIHVSSSAASEPDHICIHFLDTGIGMTEKELARIFQPFAQGDHADGGSGHPFGGLGLGLAISEELVELHGGKIAAFSQGKGKGSRFTITLPLAATTEPPLPLASPSKTEGPPKRDAALSMSGMRLLLVEDHASTRKVLSQLLLRRGFVVTAAESVASGLAAVSGKTFDLALLDLGLPDGDGYSLLRQLKSSQPKMAAIALSGYGSQDDIARSLAAGFRDHLVKPVSAAAIDVAIRKLGLLRV